MLNPLSTEELKEFAENAARLARIIRNWLPVTGTTESKSANWNTQEQWFRRVGEHLTTCERIRNPSKLAFECRGGAYHGPAVGSAPWFEIEKALDEIAAVYRLQGVADESGVPHLQYQEPVPAIEPGTLRRLELAASEILTAIESEQAPKPPESFRQYFDLIANWHGCRQHSERYAAKVIGPAVKGSSAALATIESSRWREDSERAWKAAHATPDGDRMRALMESEFGAVSFDALKKLRGRLAVSLGVGTADIDERPLNEVADILAAMVTGGLATTPSEPTGTSVGQVGRSKKRIGPPEDVQAVMRMMTLKKWKGKNPIDVCREYTRKQNPNADSDTIKREASSLKRKVNRHKN